MRHRIFCCLFSAFFILCSGLVSTSFSADNQSIQEKLMTLKQLKADGLITEEQHNIAVQEALKAWQAKSPSAETATKQPEDALTPPEALKAKEPASFPQHGEPVVQGNQPDAVPKETTKQQGQAQIPEIRWGILNSYFHITNVHQGIMKKKSIMGDLQLLPAIMFDVTAKESFNIGTTLFNAKFFDKENIEITYSVIDIKEKYNHYNWNSGSKGSGYIPIEGIDMENVASISISKSFSSF